MKKFKPYKSPMNMSNRARTTIAVADMMAEDKTRRDREAFGAVAIRTITAASIVALHDKFGFGQERLNRYQQAVEDHLACISWGTITLEELEETCKHLQDKAKLNLDEKTGYIEYREKQLGK